ncbi:hypothetical protein PTSG_04249 [Salpingoeca rosetta]|uniref:FHA domain-containing protein n=1 Tax=Salpingoeca rosetta (strain ATCC 50818 / BSB-021) TaxID=946362 RepID=F2U710_SALR5|nr:uncharacterized protein PTSG_04249 [Salpingoeca rosetta]EGD83642.1 hypothetical protein PTSG_04249 [Salpingoeca rosetta]|eukprot:XP_004995146.1 hypothetical protein PTSG_04249 [Salpingoeca rosetta]
MWQLRVQTPGKPAIVCPLVVQDEDSEATTYLITRKLKKHKERKSIVVSDVSVSRQHAEIRVQRCSGTVGQNERPDVFFTDKGSKCGSFQDGERLEPEREYLVDEYSTLELGANHTTVALEWHPLVFVGSSLPSKESQVQVQTAISKIGARLERAWVSDATHLIMLDIKATPKLILALVATKPIVSPDFLTAFTRLKTPTSPLPKAENFLPPLKDRAIPPNTSFQPDERRKALFQGKRFAFLSVDQYKKLYELVVAASGLPVLYTNEEQARAVQTDGKGHTRPDVLVVRIHKSLITAANKEWVESVKSDLRSAGLRTVNEQEITYAILQVSTNIMCNPNTSPAEVLESQSQSLGVPPSVKKHVEAALATARRAAQARSVTAAIAAPTAATGNDDGDGMPAMKRSKHEELEHEHSCHLFAVAANVTTTTHVKKKTTTTIRQPWG